MIPFNRPLITGNEEKYILQAIKSGKLSGDGEFTKKCHQWFEGRLHCTKVLLTTSCTHALEMAALLFDIREGDEVIMPSYTFVSTANAFVLRGARIVFVDIRPDTMNLDETKIESAITEKTKAIVPVHYAGIGCQMDVIMALASRYGLLVAEDAAQGMMSTYKDKPLGTIGHLGAYSFHETKNYTSSGEGGLLIINEEKFKERAEIIREKGTNRSQFFRGMVDKYTWMDLGSSYLPSEITAAFLYAQLEAAEEVNQDRRKSWNSYCDGLKELEKLGLVDLPKIPSWNVHNAHMFYIKVKDLDERTRLLEHLKNDGISSVFHYIPLHSSPAGQKFGRFHGRDQFTTKESERLIRLPLYFGMKEDEIKRVCSSIKKFLNLR